MIYRRRTEYNAYPRKCVVCNEYYLGKGRAKRCAECNALHWKEWRKADNARRAAIGICRICPLPAMDKDGGGKFVYCDRHLRLQRDRNRANYTNAKVIGKCFLCNSPTDNKAYCVSCRDISRQQKAMYREAKND